MDIKRKFYTYKEKEVIKENQNKLNKHFLLKKNNKTNAMAYKDRILSPQQLKKLSEHKYSCSSSSLMDPWLQPWWNWLVSKTPLWLAPNLITIVGLAVNIVTTLILVA